jgi:hypothetical protein
VNYPLLLSQQACDRKTIVQRTRTTLAWLTASVLVLTLLLMPQPGSAQDKLTPKFVTGLLDLPLSNYYLTPRGVIVEDVGVIAQPMLQLFFNLYEGDGPINSVTGMAGIWNSIHSKQRDQSGASTVPNWNEMDLLSSLSTTFLNSWTFTLTYEYWVSPINAFPSASHMELRLGYGDSFLKGLVTSGELSINPYINFFIELTNKTAAAPTIDESFYFELGMVPKYVFAGYPLTIELPTYLTFPGDDYYSQNSTLGVFGTGVRVTAPLTFINWRYGRWSVHADFIYKHLINDGVVFDNINNLPPHSGTRNPTQVVGGLTLYF